MAIIRFDTGWGISTIQKYRRELQDAGYLEMHQGTWNGRFSSNLYTLVPSPERSATKPSVEKESTETQSTDFQSANSKSTKRYQDTGRKCTRAGPEERHEVPEPGSSRSTAPSARAGGAADYTPSAAQSGDTPEPPVPETGPRKKAELFIKEFKRWGKAARISATVVPAERTALQEFFTENDHITPAELVAIMLAAWMMDTSTITPGTENHQSYWYCRVKSRRLKTFLQFLPNIQDELVWKGGDQQIEKIFRCAERRLRSEGTNSAAE